MKNKKFGDSEMCKCPLMGASSAVSVIDWAYMLVVGTEECTSYTKSTQTLKHGGENCFSVVLNNHDVTFGSLAKVFDALEELFLEYSPKSLFVITTCVVEIIGDDFTSIVKDASEKYNIPVHLIKTNHFKGHDENYGYDLVAEISGVKMPSKFERMMRKMKQGAKMTKEQKMSMMKAKMEA